MVESRRGADSRAVGGDRTPRESSELMTVNEVAAALRCSPRTVYRLVEMQKMPAPLKLGGMVRWPRRRIKDWVDAGCPGSGKELRDDVR